MGEIQRDALALAFYRAVVLDEYLRARPCWYAANVDGNLNCEGRIIASHIVKRRRVENFLSEQLPEGPLPVPLMGDESDNDLIPDEYDVDLLLQAAWDPRNGVPGCQAHDDRLDGHRMPPLVIPRHKLPPATIEFCEDWGLEYELERRFAI